MIGIIGAGISGLFTARELARSGFEVTVFETDTDATLSHEADADFLNWQRPGVAQLRQPHAVRALMRKTLAGNDAELYEALLASGMHEWKFHLLGIDDPDIGHDPELVGLLGRRPTLEAPLRKIVERTPGVTIIQSKVNNITIEQQQGRRRVSGVMTGDGPFLFDSLIVAAGRRSKIIDWLEASGVDVPSEECSECGIVYYSRYYRFHEGVSVPRGSYPSGPGASLPGVHFTMNRTDANTFSLMLGVAPWKEEFRALRHEPVFNEFVKQLPGAMSWLDPRISSPIWKVEPFAGLSNRYRRFSNHAYDPLVDDLYVIGDARFHTNPIQGWGMTFAMQSAYSLAQIFLEESDKRKRQKAFEQQADQYARLYYDASAQEDAARIDLWKNGFTQTDRGEPGSYRFLLTTILPAAYKDQWIFRNVMRRVHLLDDPTEILSEPNVIARARRIAATPNQTHTAGQLLAMVAQAASMESAS
ncbi:MAG: FAD-dependent oxidoreductase [Pusillimonas sp.]